MAKLPPRLNVWRRCVAWVGRHKVLTVIGGIVIAGVLYLGGSWVVLQVQIHFERERFAAASIEVRTVGNKVAAIEELKAINSNGCAHSNFGGIFEQGTVTCDSDSKVVVSSSNNEQSQMYIKQALSVFKGEHLKLYLNDKSDKLMVISSYAFTYQGVECLFEAYNSDRLTVTEGYHNAPTLTLDINCGGRARKDYFPVKYN